MQPAPTTTTPQTTTTTPEATTTTPEATTSTTVADGDSKGIGEKIKDTAGDIVDKATPADDVAEAVGSAPFDALNEAAGELAGSAFGDLAEIGNGLGEPANIVLGSLTLTLHMIAGFVAFAAIATTLLFILLAPKKKVGSRLAHLGTSSAKFLVISSLSVTLGVAMVELSGRLTNSAITLTLPETVNTENANLYDAALAVTVVPLVGVAFDFQQFFVGVLIAFWPLAAAVSILKKFENMLVVVSSLFVANIAWPPLAALAVGKAFAALPSVGAASWWCLAAVVTAPIANGIALASTKN